MPKRRARQNDTPLMEMMFGVTNDELLYCTDSEDPNDEAFLTVLAAVVRAWRVGDAAKYMPPARAIANGQTLQVVPAMRLCEPSEN